jgi:hypothetical protein
MTDQDFETFLLLLKRTLRTSKRQREAIIGELRDHLLERLDSLTAQGQSRDEAMTRALEEFGDAAVLAAQFTSISRNRTRRLIMRTTLGTIVAAAAVVIAVVAFWPQGNRAPLAPNALVAQDPPTTTPDDATPADTTPADPAPAAAQSSEEALNDATQRKLEKRVDAAFSDVPLAGFLNFIAEQAEVQTYIDLRALEDVGMGRDTPVTIGLEAPCEMLLDLVLDQLDLAYTLRSGIVIVTSVDKADYQLSVRVYDVADLLAPAAEAGLSNQQRAAQALAGLAASRHDFGGGFGGGAVPDPKRVPALEALVQLLARRQALVDAGNAEEAAKVEEEFYALALNVFPHPAGDGDELIDLIVMSINPDSWEDMGGPGTISVFRGKLVVAQTTATHRKIDALLRQLRANRADAAAE